MVWQACHFFRNWLHQNNLLLVGIFIGVALIVPTQSSPMEYFRQQAGRLLVVGITAFYWIYRQLVELAHSGPERYRHIWARMQVYRVLLGTGTQDAQRRHSNRSGRRGRSQASPRGQGRSARTPPTPRTSTSTSGAGGAKHYNNLGGRTPFGTPDRERLLVYNERVTRTKEWSKVYVEGLPQQVMMTQRGGIPHLRETIENILDWPLSEGTDFILAEAAITRQYPTQHGHHSTAATYDIALELG